MRFKDLYTYCQTLTPKISSNDIRDKVLSLTGTPSIRIIATELDISVCRGFYLSAANKEHPWVRQNGSHVIALARGITRNVCWRRFVLIKELMHLFDDQIEATDRGEALDRLLTELSVGIINPSRQIQSEINCFWMALAALCPEQNRKAFESMRQSGYIDDYGIALKLRIPEQYVPFLFSPNFEENINRLVTVTEKIMEYA